MSVHDTDQPMATLEPDLACQEHRDRRSEELWSMSPVERVQAMWAGELSFAQLREWSARRPQEVPTIGGEFAWIAILTPDWAEAGQPAAAGLAEVQR